MPGWRNEDEPSGAGERFEQLGFTFCRIGTIALIALAPTYALLVAAALSIYFYARAVRAGVRRSDCLLRHPLLIIAFWLAVGIADVIYLVTRHSAAGPH